MSQVRFYRRQLRLKTRPFPCTFCGILILPIDYEFHCLQHHGLHCCCVWCCGTESWTIGQKYRHIDHLIDCFNQFYHNSKQVRTQTQPKALDCARVVENSISPLPSIWPLDPVCYKPPPITFQSENLNLAASYLQTYLETRTTHDWFHVAMNAIDMERFTRALDRDNGGIRTLEFWCWRGDGEEAEEEEEYFRHMIAVCTPPKGRFEKEIWPQIVPFPEPADKRFRKIVSPLQFVNTLGYLSKRERFENSNDYCYYINKSLPTNFKLILATLWPGGVQELLYQETVLKNVRGRRQGKHFYDQQKGLVIPVEKRFAPTTGEITRHFIHLTRDHKLYFKPNPENEKLNQAAWLQMQFEGGNSFYDVLYEESDGQ